MKKDWSPALLSILRIVVAFLFIQHGTSKWFAFPGPLMPGGGPVPAGSLLWFAAVIETLGAAGFAVIERTEREPYEGMEYQSRRCYLLARAV